MQLQELKVICLFSIALSVSTFGTTGTVVCPFVRVLVTGVLFPPAVPVVCMFATGFLACMMLQQLEYFPHLLLFLLQNDIPAVAIVCISAIVFIGDSDTCLPTWYCFYSGHALEVIPVCLLGIVFIEETLACEVSTDPSSSRGVPIC